jgi:hypothetical protein
VNEAGWACGTLGRGEKIVQGFGGMFRRKEEIKKERDHLEDQDVGGKMGSEWILG